MIKSICATLLLCSFFNYNFDFKYSNKDEFVRGITECTVHFNTAIPPQYRGIVVISVAQAILESNWGESRFAKLGNNFYGIIQTDKTEPHIKSLNSDIMLKVYGNKCESVADYIDLLNTSSAFAEYRELRLKQVLDDNVDVPEVIKTLKNYAVDPEYVDKLLFVTLGLFRKYPHIFKSQEISEYYKNNKKT